MKRLGLVLIILGGLTACISLDTNPIYNQDNTAVNGYDVVAYFTENKAVQGTTAYSVQYQQVTWLFSSAKHQALFTNHPQQYIPQYGGYCAYAMAHGFVVETDPQAFSIVNNKLFLNYSLGVRETWQADQQQYIIDANQEWFLLKQRRN